MKVDYVQDISKSKRSHYWYGGQVAIIKYKNCIFSIEAIGDVRATLYNVPLKDEDTVVREELAYVKDKNNGGCFYDYMSTYLDSDKDLHHAIETERLELDNNNWWECFVTTPDGVFHDLMWCLDADTIDEAIEEVKENLEHVYIDVMKDSIKDRIDKVNEAFENKSIMPHVCMYDPSTLTCHMCDSTERCEANRKDDEDEQT